MATLLHSQLASLVMATLLHSQLASLVMATLFHSQCQTSHQVWFVHRQRIRIDDQRVADASFSKRLSTKILLPTDAKGARTRKRYNETAGA